ncbi:MAG: hypothetical protein RR444_12555 [Oscillospiraceae bacterium]
MSNQKIKTCDYCDDGNGECVFPYYGLGVYTHCLNCGGDGTYDGVVLEPKADAEG